MSYISQPAYTEAFLSAIASAVAGVNVANYPPPSGYQVYVTNDQGTVDSTTNVGVYNISDEFQNNSEVTSVTFIAVFSNLNGYSFNGVSFYTQVSGQDFMEIADFILPTPIQKPSNYALLLLITFSITTPTYIIDAIQDVEELCSEYCQNTDCSLVSGNIQTLYIPFSLFNLTFLYLLGINVNTFEQSPDIQQLIQQYSKCIDNCSTFCNKLSPIACGTCITACKVYLSESPILIFLISNGIQSISQLLPQGINTVYPINVCSGSVATLTPENLQYKLNVISPSEVQYTVQFYLPGINQLFNALQIMISTQAGYNYSLGVLYFIGIPLPNGETFALEVTVSAS